MKIFALPSLSTLAAVGAQYTNGRPTCSWQRRREATINNRKHYCHFVTCPSPQYDCSVPSLPRESWMFYPGLQVDAEKRREEKLHSKRENVSIQSFSINEAEDFLNASMKLNQIPVYRRGDRQPLCVFTAYSVLPDGTVVLTRMRKVHLNKAGRAQHSSKPMEKLKDILPISKRFPHTLTTCSVFWESSSFWLRSRIQPIAPNLCFDSQEQRIQSRENEGH